MAILLLLFLALPAQPAHADQSMHQNMLSCARALSRGNNWIVPGSLNQIDNRRAYDPDHNILYFWSQKQPATLLIYAGESLYAASVPRVRGNMDLLDIESFQLEGLPQGKQFFTYNVNSIQRSLRYLDPEGNDNDRETGYKITARAPTAEETTEAKNLFFTKMGALYGYRDDLKNPSWFSQVPNFIHGNEAPTTEEIRAIDDYCAPFFTPDSELNCRETP